MDTVIWDDAYYYFANLRVDKKCEMGKNPFDTFDL